MISQIKEELLKEKTPQGNLRSQSTANRYLATLSCAFSLAVNEWGWLKENPISKISRFKEGKAREGFLTKEEIEKLLEVCKESKSPHLYPVTLFALSSGARRGEILGLKWKYVDLDRKVPTFRNTKNGEHRSVPLSNALAERLWKVRRLRNVISEYVFPSSDGSKPADVREAWENAVEKAGLSGLCFHTLAIR